MPLSGLAVAEIGVGGIVLYSGIKGYSMADTFTWLLKGTVPKQTEQIGQPNYPDWAATANQAAAGAAAAAAAGANAVGAASSATAVQNQSTAKKILAQMGLSSWTSGQEWQDLVSLWTKESGWNSNAQNPTSTAYGIAQFLNTTWAPYGAKTSDPATQIKYGIQYIEQRYGSPVMAWAHETANNWY